MWSQADGARDLNHEHSQYVLPDLRMALCRALHQLRASFRALYHRTSDIADAAKQNGESKKESWRWVDGWREGETAESKKKETYKEKGTEADFHTNIQRQRQRRIEG